jgi:sec-independent protein translocase protein TatA
MQAMGRVGTQELFLVLALVILFFGGQKIPELMKGIGEGMREFRKGLDEGKRTPL